MAVPDFQTLMLPFLNVMADQKEHTFSEVENDLIYFIWTGRGRKDGIRDYVRTINARW